MHRLAIQKQNMKNMEQASAAQILFSRACIDAKTVYQALFHESASTLPPHCSLPPRPKFYLVCMYVHGSPEGGVKYGRPV